MKKILKLSVLLLLSLGLFSQNITPVVSWGYSAHETTVVKAADLLPEHWTDFLLAYQSELVVASLLPDDRTSGNPAEAPRHYDDSDVIHDDYNVSSDSDDYDLGVISWAIENATRDLEEAIKANDLEMIIEACGVLSHYAADSTMPFHATVNYNGQLTGNDGIHARVEISLINFYYDELYSDMTFEPLQEVDPYTETKSLIASGLALVPDFLAADDLALIDSDNSYDSVYYESFYSLIGDEVKERLKLAIQHTANLWYTAIKRANLLESTIPIVSLAIQNGMNYPSSSLTVDYYAFTENANYSAMVTEGGISKANLSFTGKGTFELTSLSESEHTILLELYYLNVSVANWTYIFSVDLTPPICELTVTVTGRSVQFNYSSNEPLKHVKVSIDGSYGITIYNGKEITFTAGNHTLDVSFTDLAGHVTTLTEEVTLVGEDEPSDTNDKEDDATFNFLVFSSALISIVYFTHRRIRKD